MPRPGNMLYLISYDIPSTTEGDARRSRVARYLQGIGLRIQNSVFEVVLPSEKIPSIASQIREIMDQVEDSIRIYPLCARCRGDELILGRKAPVEYQETLIW